MNSERRIHLLDFDNLVGGTYAAAEDFVAAWQSYLTDGAPVLPGDQVFAAASHYSAQVGMFALKGQPIQWRVRSGVDGADLALLDSIDVEHAARRFGTLVLATGDHIFTDLAIAAGSLGMRVHQVVGRGFSSYLLAAACPTRSRLRLDAVSDVMLAA